jgi:hypothetical protein
MLSTEEKIRLGQQAAALFSKARLDPLTRDEKEICRSAYYVAPSRYLPREFFQWVEDNFPALG